jgi:hypothetical protein
MEKEFEKNRKSVQDRILDSKFLQALTIDDIPYKIIEAKNTKEHDRLQSLTIHNIPISTNSYLPKSWVIDLEMAKGLFSAPQEVKKGEKAILFFSKTTLYILIIEMKSSLKATGDSGLRSIEQKIIHSIGRISMFLPIYLFDCNSAYETLKISYKAIICYNQERITQEINQDEGIKSQILYKVFNKESNSVNLQSREFGVNHRVETFFLKNTSKDKSEMEIDLATIFKASRDNDDFLTCEHSELSCP